MVFNSSIVTLLIIISTFLGVIIYVVQRLPKIMENRRLNENKIIEFCEYLQKDGIEASVLDDKNEEFIKEPLLRFVRSSYQLRDGLRINYAYWTWKCVKIESRSIDLIQLETIYKAQSYGAESVFHLRRQYRREGAGTFVYPFSYAILVDAKGLEKELIADFEPIENHKDLDKVVNYEWSGGNLAEVLKEDSELQNRLISLGLSRLEIRPI